MEGSDLREEVVDGTRPEYKAKSDRPTERDDKKKQERRIQKERDDHKRGAREKTKKGEMTKQKGKGGKDKERAPTKACC